MSTSSGIARWISAAAFVSAAVGVVSLAHAGTRLEKKLREELALAQAAVEIERGVEALRTEAESLTFAQAIMRDRTRESMRKLAAYRDSRSEGEQRTKARTRALYQLSRGGLPRLLVESRLERTGQDPEMTAAARVQRGRALRQLIQSDMRVLKRHQRAEARARAELVETSRELASLSSLQLVRGLQQGALSLAVAEIDPQVRRARTRRVFAMSGDQELSSRERRLLRLVGKEYRALNYGKGLDLLDHGALKRPVAGRVVGSFGTSRDALLGIETHRDGVEIRASRRARGVLAAADGRVVAVGDLPGYEEVVVLEHEGGFLSLTGHLRSVVVSQGDAVKRGQRLGQVATKQLDDGLGRTVYFELRHGERPINPTRFLERR